MEDSLIYLVLGSSYLCYFSMLEILESNIQALLIVSLE